jgi:hypothetical protein
MKRLLIVIALILLGCFIIVSLLVLVNSPHIFNAYTRKLMCQNTLKAIAQAIELYRADWDEVFPPSLLELNPYVEEKYRGRGPKGVPSCPGDRAEDETTKSREYVYQPPLNTGEIVPICWDSKPHRTKGIILPDTLLWIVLYSDGHVDRLHYDEFLKEMARVAAKKPDVLAQIELPERPKRGPRFLFGLIVGIAAGYLIWGRRKKTTTASECG